MIIGNDEHDIPNTTVVLHKYGQSTATANTTSTTVKPAWKDHPRETEKAVFIDRWSLYTGGHVHVHVVVWPKWFFCWGNWSVIYFKLKSTLIDNFWWLFGQNRSSGSGVMALSRTLFRRHFAPRE